MPFYAVRHGHAPGIYSTWEECEKQVKGFSKAQFKKFETYCDAFEFIVLKSPNQKSQLTNNEKDNLKFKSTDKLESHKRKLELSDSENNKTSPSNTNTNNKYKTNNELNTTNTAINSNTIETKDGDTHTDRDKDARVENNKKQKLETSNTTSKNNELKPKTSTSTSTSSVNKSINLNSPNRNKTKLITEYEDKRHNFSFEGQKVSVYTDGACSNNGKSTAIAGIGVFWGVNHPLNISKRLLGMQTNIRAEITAAIVAISQALSYNASELTIYTDSQFMINCMELWIKKWKINGWKSNDGKPIKNIDDLKRLDDLLSKMKVNWKFVPSHKGIFGNEEADKLATQCLK